MSEIRSIENLDEAVSLLDFQDVIYYELRGQRRDGFDDLADFEGDPDRPPKWELNVLTSDASSSLAVRGQLKTEGEMAVVQVDVAVVFAKHEEFSLPESVRDAFLVNVGLMTLFPYLRESVHELSTKLGESLRLSLLRREMLREHTPVASEKV